MLKLNTIFMSQIITIYTAISWGKSLDVSEIAVSDSLGTPKAADEGACRTFEWYHFLCFRMSKKPSIL